MRVIKTFWLHFSGSVQKPRTRRAKEDGDLFLKSLYCLNTFVDTFMTLNLGGKKSRCDIGIVNNVIYLRVWLKADPGYHS